MSIYFTLSRLGAFKRLVGTFFHNAKIDIFFHLAKKILKFRNV